MLCLEQRPNSEGTHILCSVEQGETFLRGELYRLPVVCLQCLGSRNHLALVFHLAQTYERQTEVCPRHEVARSAKRALHIDNRINVVVEEIYQSLHGVELTTGIAVAERLDLEQHHNLHDVVWHAVAYATGMRHHEVDLQLCQLVGIYRHIAQ